MHLYKEMFSKIQNRLSFSFFLFFFFLSKPSMKMRVYGPLGETTVAFVALFTDGNAVE